MLSSAAHGRPHRGLRADSGSLDLYGFCFLVAILLGGIGIISAMPLWFVAAGGIGAVMIVGRWLGGAGNRSGTPDGEDGDRPSR